MVYELSINSTKHYPPYTYRRIIYPLPLKASNQRQVMNVADY